VNFSAKVMLLGDIGVGKTSLAKRLMFGKFDNDYKTTIGVDILTHELTLPIIPEPATAKLLLWDTDGDFGQHIFKSVYLAGASGALVISDASRPSTIQKMFDLAASFLERLPGRSVRAVINKTDIVKPDLSGVDLRGLQPEAVLFSSAKTGDGVEAAFAAIAADIYRRL
jgi:GTPase SAR1 family protein